MDVQEVDVTIDKDGQVHVQVRGAKGLACLDLTRDLEAALGGQVVERVMTPEALELGEELPLENRIKTSGRKKG